MAKCLDGAPRGIRSLPSTFLELVLLPFAALVLRVINLDSRALWWDEGRNIFFARLDWVTAAQTAIRSGDTNPPIFRMLLREWMRLVGPSPFAIRLLSVLIGVVTVAILYRLGAYVFGRRAGRIAGVLAAASPPLIYYSQEAKGYALVIFAVSLSVWIWIHIHRPFLSPTRLSDPSRSYSSLVAWPLFTFATMLAVGSHFFASLFVLVENLWTMALTWRIFPRVPLGKIVVHWTAWLGSQFIAVAFLLLYVSTSAATLLGVVDTPLFGVSLLPQLTSGDLARWGAATEVNYDEPFRRLLEFLWGLMEEIIGGPDATQGLAALALLALAPATFLGAKHLGRNYHGISWSLWIVLPVILSGFFVLKFSYFYPRFLLFVLPAILLLSAAGASWLFRRKLIAAFLLALPLVVAWVATLRLHYANPGDSAEDWRALITTFAQYQKTGDLAIHSYDWIAGYLHSYLGPGMEPNYFHYVKGEEDAFEAAAHNQGRIWFLDYKASPFDVGNQAGAIMRARSAVAYTRGFGNAHLTLFSLPSLVINPFDIVDANNVQFEGGVGLQWIPVDTELSPGDVLAVELVWQALEAPLPQYQVFLHLIDADGSLIIGRDSGPVNDLRPTHSWASGERVPSLHAVLLPTDLAAGHYQVRTGLYELGSGLRQRTIEGVDSAILGRVILVPE